MGLREARNWIRYMKENNRYKGEKIGRIKKDVHGLTSQISGFPIYKRGEVVIYREEMNPPYVGENAPAEWRDKEQVPSGTATIERPLSQEDIDKHRKKGSLITTILTMSSVPLEFIQNIPA